MAGDCKARVCAERFVLAASCASFVAGCCIPGLSGSAPPPPPATTVPTVAPVAPPAPPPVAGAACLAGRWQASEIMALIERDMRASTRGGDVQLVGSTGKLVLEIGPADATGAGTMAVRSEDLVHRFHGRVQGMNIDVVHTLTGTATMPYAFVAPDGLRVDRPTENNMRGRAVANAGGYRMSQGSGARFDLRGTYVFVCTPATMVVTKPGGRPVTFTRE